MNKKLALIAASVIAISAHANAHAQEAEPITEDKGMLETLLSDEQPPLEGDSPLVDEDAVVASEAEGDDALIGEPYAQDEDDALTTTDTDVLTAQELSDVDGEQADPAFADTDPTVSDDPMTTDMQDDDAPALATGAEGLDDTDRAAMTPGEAVGAAPMADDSVLETAETGTDTDVDTDTTEDAVMTADVDATEVSEPSEPLPAPDAKIAAVPTDPTEASAEAALIAGTYEVTIPNRPGTSTLFIEGRGTEAAGTFDGQPIDVIVTGRNFSFDAPVSMGGEEQLMTFAGTAEDGVIDNGVIEAQGDGGYLTFDARRVDAASADSVDAGASGFGTDAMTGDAADTDSMDMDATETDEAETGFGVTGGDVLDDASDETGFDDTYEDGTFGTDESDVDASLDADVPADMATGAEDRADAAARAAGFTDTDDAEMSGDAMDTESASDALTTDGGLEGDADDLGTDDFGTDESDVDASLDTDVPADMATGAEDRADAAARAAGFTETDDADSADDLDDADDEAGDPNFEF